MVMPTNRTVPTSIVNKNGVSTTVHKRVDNSSSVGPLVIPPPSKPVRKNVRPSHGGVTVETIKSDGRSLGRLILNEMGRKSYRLSEGMKVRTLETLHPETLGRLDQYNGVVTSIFTRAIISSLKERNFSLLNNIGMLFDMCKESEYTSFGYYVAGLNADRPVGAAFRDYSEASETELEPVRAIVYAAMNLKTPYTYSSIGADSPWVCIKSTRLADLIAERHHEVNDIVELVRERKLPVDTDEDIEVLVGMLDDNPTRALRDGIL